MRFLPDPLALAELHKTISLTMQTLNAQSNAGYIMENSLKHFQVLGFSSGKQKNN